MNEKEKETIERIEDTFWSDLGKGINKFQKITLYEDGIRDVRILLNLIEKIQRENETYTEKIIKLDNELNLEKEKSKYEWIRQNCLPQNLVNKLYVSVQKIKDKIENLQNEKEEYYSQYKIDELNDKIQVLQELLESEE